MDRTQHATATAENMFTDGDPAQGVSSTVVEAKWLNLVQEEICNAVTEFGEELDGESSRQLADVIKRECHAEYILSNYDSLPAILAVLSVGGNPDATIVIDEVCTLESDTTIPGNIMLRFVGGGYFTGTDVQLYLDCDIIAGNQRIFDVGTLSTPGPGGTSASGSYSGVTVRGVVYETNITNIPEGAGEGERDNYTTSGGFVVDHIGVRVISSACSPQFSTANLRWFGAVGDGVTDDHAACQAWADYVAEAGVLGYAPGGSYGLNDKDVYFWRRPNTGYVLIPKSTTEYTVHTSKRIHMDGLFVRGDGPGGGFAGTEFRDGILIVGDDRGNLSNEVTSLVTGGTITVNYYNFTDRVEFRDFSVRQGTIRAHYCQSGVDFINVHLLVYKGSDARTDVDPITGHTRRVDRSAGMYMHNCLVVGFRNVSVGSYSDSWDTDGTGVVINGCNKFYWFGGRVGSLPNGIRTYDPYYADLHDVTSGASDGFLLSTSVTLYNVYCEDNLRRCIHAARVTNCLISGCTFHPGTDYDPSNDPSGVGRLIDVGQKYHSSEETRNVRIVNARFRHNDGTSSTIKQNTVGIHCENAENVSIDTVHFRRPPATLVKIVDSRDQYIDNDSSNGLSEPMTCGSSNDNWSCYAIMQVTRDDTDISGLSMTNFDLPSDQGMVRGPVYLDDAMHYEKKLEIETDAGTDEEVATFKGTDGTSIRLYNNGHITASAFYSRCPINTVVSTSEFGFAVGRAGIGLIEHARDVSGTGIIYRGFGNGGEIRHMGDGDILNTTGNSVAPISSDERLKENIKDATSQWEDIKGLPVRNFNYIDNPDRTFIGFIAQEVGAVCPQLMINGIRKCGEKVYEGEVVEDENGNLFTPEGLEVTQYYTFQPTPIYIKAIKALQEAMARIETLEAENTELSAALTALTDRVTALESM